MYTADRTDPMPYQIYRSAGLADALGKYPAHFCRKVNHRLTGFSIGPHREHFDGCSASDIPFFDKSIAHFEMSPESQRLVDEMAACE